MLYRLCPPGAVTWSDLPGSTIDLVGRNSQADLERLDWAPTESRVFSWDLLRIAVRHGVATSAGLVLDVGHTVELGRADELRSTLMDAAEARASLREGANAQLMERTFPGWAESGRKLDVEVHNTIEAAAREAEVDLKEVLSAPVQPELVAHWRRLGGVYPD